MLFEEPKKKKKKKKTGSTKGVKVRGTGTATKGLCARGPMA